MTIARLERLPKIIKEIEQLSSYLDDVDNNGPPRFSAIVKTAAKFPYALHNITITGENHTIVEAWQNTLSRNKSEYAEINSFIQSINDEQIRAILRYKYHDGLTWQAIAMKIGFRDWRTPKKNIEKFLSMHVNAP